MTVEPLGGERIVIAVQTSQIDPRWRIEPEEFCAPDMYPVEHRKARHLYAPGVFTLFARVDGFPYRGLLGLKLRQLNAMVLADIGFRRAPDGAVKCSDGRDFRDAEGSGDFVVRNSAEA